MGRDRFVGWQAGVESGRLLTRQLVLGGDRLEINCRTQARNPPGPEWGEFRQIKAELLQPGSENGPATPYPGYSMADCDPVKVMDEFARVITWRGSPDLAPLRGKKVYVRFNIQSATLYSFRIGDSRSSTDPRAGSPNLKGEGDNQR